MLTAISIVLYGLAVVFGYLAGVTAKDADYGASGFGVVVTVVLFVAGAALQVWG